MSLDLHSDRPGRDAPATWDFKAKPYAALDEHAIMRTSEVPAL